MINLLIIQASVASDLEIANEGPMEAMGGVAIIVAAYFLYLIFKPKNN